VTESLRPGGIAIAGPTASGKSALAMRIAELIPVEIISVDSAQVYRGMDIGTAKPTREERARVPHHLIDIRDPEQGYSAGEFSVDALRLIEQIHSRGAMPLLVGGTMLYFRALFHGIADLPVANAEVRAAIDARAAKSGWPALHAELALRDPAAAARIHPHDAQRIQRALEVLELSGRTLDEHWQAQQPMSVFGDWNFCSLESDNRELLHQRIAQRLDAMLTQDLQTRSANCWRATRWMSILPHCAWWATGSLRPASVQENPWAIRPQGRSTLPASWQKGS
jgi:tRNA dimethylallyltransferase